MGILALLKTLFTIIGKVVSIYDRKKLLDLGETKEENKNLKQSLKDIQNANTIRNSNSLPDDVLFNKGDQRGKE